MKIKLTRTSQDSLNKILKKRMNAAEAADYLRNKPTVFRSFGETLSGMFAGDDLVGTLRAYYLELDPTLNPRTVTRKLQNWTKDRNLPSRDDIFRIAFALGLTEEELDYLLAIATGYCIQYRDGRELVLAWFLRNGLPYEEALAFFETLPAYKPANALPSTTHTQLTHQIETSSFTIYTTDDLRAYYCANLHRFGTQHLRAYFYFDRYLEQLVQPTPLPGEKPSAPFSIDTVMEEYLALNMPPGRRRTKLTVVQKLIKQNWPNTTALTNMKNHVIDVPRKVLMLLYVVTENLGFDDYDDDLYPDEKESFEDRVADHWVVLNAILADCGMAQLDMRSAFDWLVLYAVAVEDDEAMSERLAAVIASLYE